MSLVFAAITPHPPLLLENIGKEKTAMLQATKEALEKLEQELYLSKAEIVFVFTPHGGLFEDAYSVNAHTNFQSHFEEFGDLSTKKEWGGSPEFAARIRQRAVDQGTHVQLLSNELLDHAAAVPLFFLTTHLPEIKILPIGFSAENPESHVAFGKLIKETIMQSDKRIAVIASGDLCHTLSDDAPHGYDAHGASFDEHLISLLEEKNWNEIMKIDESMVANAKECGYRCILMLLGIIEEMQPSFTTLCYESPFGVGYLTGTFDI